MTALVSFGVYAALWGMPLAGGLMAGMAVHEAGHLWVLARLGLPSSPPLFIPMVGAVVHMDEPPLRPEDQLWLALAGPACGMAFSALCILAALWADSPFLLVLGVLLVLLNCVDLLPMGPLDGGRALRAWRAMGR